MKKETIISLAIMLLAGLFFLIHPGDSLTLACRIFGIALILAGAIGTVSEIGYGVNKNDKWLACYIVEILTGILVLAAPEFVINLFPFIIGLILVAFGIVDIVRAVLIFLETVDGWKGVLLFAIITVILGIVIMCNPFGTSKLLVRIIGLVLIYRAVSDLILYARYAKLN